MEFQKVLPADSSIVMFAKIAVNQGRSPGIEKHDFYDAIVKRADELRADGESPQKSFVAGVAKAAAPPDPSEDYVSPSARTPAAADELDRLVVTRMKSDPKLSYQQAFTTEYLAPANRSLKERVDSESILRAQAREPAKPFPAYARG
jgi:hypothetical protein